MALSLPTSLRTDGIRVADGCRRGTADTEVGSSGSLATCRARSGPLTHTDCGPDRHPSQAWLFSAWVGRWNEPAGCLREQPATVGPAAPKRATAIRGTVATGGVGLVDSREGIRCLHSSAARSRFLQPWVPAPRPWMAAWRLTLPQASTRTWSPWHERIGGWLASRSRRLRRYAVVGWNTLDRPHLPSPGYGSDATGR